MTSTRTQLSRGDLLKSTPLCNHKSRFFPYHPLADRMALLRLETAKQARELQAVVNEYISLKASMQRMRAGLVSRKGRAMRARDETPADQMAHNKRAKLLELFPGRPWVDHADYKRLEAGDTTVGCALAPMPARSANAVENMSGGV